MHTFLLSSPVCGVLPNLLSSLVMLVKCAHSLQFFLMKSPFVFSLEFSNSSSAIGAEHKLSSQLPSAGKRLRKAVMRRSPQPSPSTQGNISRDSTTGYRWQGWHICLLLWHERSSLIYSSLLSPQAKSLFPLLLKKIRAETSSHRYAQWQCQLGCGTFTPLTAESSGKETES